MLIQYTAVSSARALNLNNCKPKKKKDFETRDMKEGYKGRERATAGEDTSKNTRIAFRGSFSSYHNTQTHPIVLSPKDNTHTAESVCTKIQQSGADNPPPPKPQGKPHDDTTGPARKIKRKKDIPVISTNTELKVTSRLVVFFPSQESRYEIFLAPLQALVAFLEQLLQPSRVHLFHLFLHIFTI